MNNPKTPAEADDHHQVNMNVRHPPPPSPRVAPARRRVGKRPFTVTSLKPTVNPAMLPTYEKFRDTVFNHIRKRREKHNFERTDEISAELLARYLTDYLYLEEYATQTPEHLARNTAALNPLTSNILHLLDELLLTPRGRLRVWEELQEELKSNVQVKEALEKLMGTPKRSG